MGKGTRKRDIKQKQMKMLRRERERKLEERRRLLKYSLITLAVIVCISGVVFAWIGIDGAIKDSGSTLRSNIGVKTEHFNVDNAMMSYFLNATYQSYANYYGTSISSILETDKPLKSQIYQGTTTWFDYFLDAAENTVRSLLVLAEDAYDEGVTLTDAENDAIDTYLSNRDSSAFGRGVNVEDAKRCLQLMALAYKYEDSVQKSLEPTVEEITAYYNDNRNSYDLIDYYYYEFKYDDDTKDAVKASAAELAAITTPEEFIEFIGKYASENDATASLTARTNATKTSVEYDADDDFSVWAFGTSASLNATKTIDSTSSVKVYMLTKLPSPDESLSKSIMHILVSDSTFGTKEEASLKAAEILSNWEVNDGTAEGFAGLALAYSEDSGSSMKGGAYYNVTPGTMVEEFNDWCFDEARKPGDTGIVETTYGYHIMYFIGDGPEVYRAQVTASLIDTEYDAFVKALQSEHTVTVDDGILAKIYE